jgi:hypothetical protein
MCLIDLDSKVIHQWEVDGVPPESSDGLYVSLRKHLDARPWVLEAQTVLIEKQPDRNRKMQCVEHFLNAYFIIKYLKHRHLEHNQLVRFRRDQPQPFRH